MSKLLRSSILLGFVIVLASACTGNIPASPTTSVAQNVIETMVASTLTALEQNNVIQSTDVGPTQPIVTQPPVAFPNPGTLHVAFVMNNDVWIWIEGNSPFQLTAFGDVNNVRISSDGQQVAYLRNLGPLSQELWVVNSDGSNNRILKSQTDLMASFTGTPGDQPAGIGVFQFDWRPGKHKLYFSTRPLFEGPGLGGFDDLHYIDTDSMSGAVLFPADQGGRFTFSPDGDRIALITPTSISLLNLDGSALYRDVLVYPYVITYSEYFYYPKPVWSSTSNELRVVIPPQDPQVEPLPPSTVYSLQVNGSPAVAIGTIMAIPYAWPDDAISPDLNRLGFAQPVDESDSNLRDINLANADGSGIVWYMNGEGAEFMGWLPNSRQFVFQVASGPDVGIHVSSLAEGYFTLSSDPLQIGSIRWVDDTHYLSLWQNGGIKELKYNVLNGVQFTVASGQIWGFDFTK